MDHVEMFRPSIEDIAWHKSGIFKIASPAFTCDQEPAAAAALSRRAIEKGVTVGFVHISPTLPINVPTPRPDVQKTNSSLALALVPAFLR